MASLPNIGEGIHAIGAKLVASFGPNSHRITTLDRVTARLRARSSL